MNARVRRLLTWGTVVIVLLFVGRWAAEFITARWWALSIGPAAETFLTRWTLLGIALDLTAIGLASAWFAIQAVLVARVIATVQVERQEGPIRVREPIPIRLLVLAGVGIGVLLGVITGAGARGWRAPLMLAWEGVTYGITDPLLGKDLGVFVAQLPIWSLVHGFVLALVLLGLLLAAVLYLAIGGIKRRPDEVYVHPDARRHLGLLLTLVALVLSAGALLTPYQLAASADPPLGLLASRTRVVAAQALAGGALAVALMSLAWAVRARHSMVLAGWIVLGLGAAVERFLVPAFAAEGTGSPTRDADLRALETELWGLRFAEPSRMDSTAPIIAPWGVTSVTRALSARGLSSHSLLATTVPDSMGRMRPLWIAAATRPDAGDVLDVFTIDAAIAAPDGHALTSARLSLPDGRIHPSAPAWRAVADGGVRAGSILRRVTLAWARQAPTMLRVAPSHAVDWHLDPLDRVEALLPMLSWRVGGLVIVNERAVWLATGFATTDAAPLMMPRAWGTRRVASARPAIIATIDAASGATAFVSDPAAGPLGHAWGRIAGPMVAPPAAMDSALRAALDYPTEWLEAQLGILEGGAWQIGRRPGRRVADGPPEPPVWGWDGSGAFRRTAFEDPARRLITAVVTARRRGGVPELEVARVEATAIENGRELERRWSRGVTLSRLRDSVRAAGDSLVAGALHWHVGPDGLAAWTSYTSEGRRGEPTLLWIATAHDATMGGGRTALSAWSSLATTDADGSAIPSVDPDASERLGAIQGWVRRADSALARGDLTAFGRAWEALRGLLDELEAP